MLTGMKHLHSTLAVILLLALVISIVITAINYFGSKPYNRKIALIGLISAHLQLLVGIIYYYSLGYFSMFSSGVMKDPTLRFKLIEHPLTMIIGIILITVGYSKAKKAPADYASNKIVFITYTIALIVLLSRIPWSSWSIIN